ncbi:hypothetical protein [Vibrio sp. TRT 1302]|uniref:hypothetical protein n=1 Tax=Vibrio sp. TRT 1302 TaxID=3418504 RepID=UPI003CEB32EF
MSNKAFFSIHGGIYAVFALALFFMPRIMWPMYGVEINDQYAYFLSQHTSIFLGGVAAVSLFLKEIEHRETVRQLLKALLTTNLLGVAITGYAGVTGIFVGFGWSDPAFFALLSLISYRQLMRHHRG